MELEVCGLQEEIVIENSLLNQAQAFLKRSFAVLEQKKFVLDEHWHIDHLCYRTSSIENYLAIKNQLELFSKLLIESEVNGRLISTFKLTNPLVFNGWEIDLIEVPAPKTGKITADGFEHFEVVTDLTFDEIKSRYAQFPFDESGLTKDINQELEFSFDEFALKFHHLSLESVINVEINSSIYSALKNSNILKILKPFSPLIAGTIPLNINVASSDLDILISADDLDLAKRVLTENFNNSLNFKSEEIFVKNELSLLMTFSYQGIDFEIFGQRIPTVKQQGYLHFLIEERLLKIGGNLFAQKIIQAKGQGFKTEPAFFKVLGLNGNSYEELLTIQKQSNSELRLLLNKILF